MPSSPWKGQAQRCPMEGQSKVVLMGKNILPKLYQSGSAELPRHRASSSLAQPRCRINPALGPHQPALTAFGLITMLCCQQHRVTLKAAFPLSVGVWCPGTGSNPAKRKRSLCRALKQGGPSCVWGCPSLASYLSEKRHFRQHTPDKAAPGSHDYALLVNISIIANMVKKEKRRGHL